MTPTFSYVLLDEDDLFGGNGGDDAFICLGETLEPLAGLVVQTDYKCNGKFVSGVIHVGSATTRTVQQVYSVPPGQGAPNSAGLIQIRSGSSFTFQSSFFKGFVLLHF